jgi:hypothetical protein
MGRDFKSSLWPPGTVVLSREELHQRVWETPISQLAREFGLSDSAIAKICKRHDVPRPRAGYWNRKRKGRKIPLPPRREAKLQLIPFRPRPLQEDTTFDEEVRDWLNRARGLKQVEVSASLRKPHEVVMIAEKLRRDPGDNWSFDTIVKVSPKQLRRALRILNSLIKATEAIGGHFVVEKGWRRGQQSAVYLCGEKATAVRVREVCRRPEPKEERYGLSDPEPTGALVIDSGPACSRIYYRDSEKTRIEDGINQILIAWLEELGKERIQRRRREEEDRERQEHNRRAQELREQQETERLRLDALLADAAAWEQSRILRCYIEAVGARSRGAGDQESFEQWLDWAKTQADSLDPLMPISRSS